MPKTIKAVTVTKDYLNRKIWVVKILTVFKRRDGTPYWFVTQTFDSDPNYDTMIARGLHYCIEERLPFIPDVNHGQNLTECDKECLKMYDLVP